MDPADQSQLRSAVEAQGALLGQHQGELVAAHQTMDSLVSQVTELTETIRRMQTDRNPVAPVIERPLVTPEPRINNPPIYSGEPTMCRAFMIQCEVIFSLQPLTYASDTARVAFVISLLAGRAREWATSVWAAEAACCEDFFSFKAEFVKIFDRSALGKEASRLLAALRQGRRSVADFAIEFRTLAASSMWNEAALVARFTEALEDDIRDEMYAHELPEHLDELVDLAIRLDNRRDLRRRARFPPSPSLVDLAPTSSVSAAPDHLPAPEAMQLGRYRLSAEEKQKRLSKGQCLYCGRLGHFASSCPAKANARQ